MKRIVVIGAGYAGILIAKKLEKKLKKLKDIDITLIDKNPYHTMLTELHEVAAARVDEESIRISLKKVFAHRKVNLVVDKVTNVDFDKKTIICENSEHNYDYLVIAAGSKPTFFGNETVEKYSFKLWSYDDAIKLNRHFEDCFHEASRESNLEKRKKMLSFFVVGAGFTGIEMAGEMAEWFPILAEKHGIDLKEVRIVNLDLADRAVPIMPEKISNKVEKRLKKLNVELKYGFNVVGMTEDSITFQKADNKFTEKTNTVIWAAGIEASDITTKIAEDLPSANRGRIHVTDYLNTETRPEVYVAGDNMMFIDKNTNRPVPQMVENCESSAKTVANNLIVDITGKGKKEEYKPDFHGAMVCVGGRYGVAHVGAGKHFFSLPSFLAMFSKHFINIIYFISVLGWAKIFNYLKHEFFTIKNDRSFLGGHFSNKTPSFLLVFLRIWLGLVWLFEGSMKVVEGWLKVPKLGSFFNGASSWYHSILISAGKAGLFPEGSDAISGASVLNTTADVVELTNTVVNSDAASSASQVAGDVASSMGTVLMDLDIFGLIRFIFVSGKNLAESKISDYAFKIDIPFMNNMLDRFVLSSDGMQIFMQSFIVVVEILIGLALIAGLLNFISAAVSIVLQFMFLTTTGLYLSTIWMIFAGIAVLVGGGRVFGFDYYVMPILGKVWKNTKFMKKWYLYND